jgi:hypothetical protein
VGSTERAAALGDRRWREVLESFYPVVGVWAVRRSVRVGTLALTLHLLASSLVAVAQPTGKMHRVGFLRHFACLDQFGLKDLRQRLGELGYIEGRNIVRG